MVAVGPISGEISLSRQDTGTRSLEGGDFGKVSLHICSTLSYNLYTQKVTEKLCGGCAINTGAYKQIGKEPQMR